MTMRAPVPAGFVPAGFVPARSVPVRRAFSGQGSL